MRKQIFNIRVASILIVQVTCCKLLTALKTSMPPHLREQGLGQGAQARGAQELLGSPLVSRALHAIICLQDVACSSMGTHTQSPVLT